MKIFRTCKHRDVNTKISRNLEYVFVRITMEIIHRKPTSSRHIWVLFKLLEISKKKKSFHFANSGQWNQDLYACIILKYELKIRMKYLTTVKHNLEYVPRSRWRRNLIKFVLKNGVLTL